MNVAINRLDPNLPDPVESRRRAAGRLVRIAYATMCSACIAFFVVYFGAPLVFLSGPGTVTAPRYVVSLPYTVQVTRMNVMRGATVKAGEEIAEVIRRSRTASSRLHARARGYRRPHGGAAHQGQRRAGLARRGARLSARDRGSGATVDAMATATVTFRMEDMRERA